MVSRDPVPRPGLANLFSRAAPTLALGLIIAQDLWIVAAAATIALGGRSTRAPVIQAA